MPVSTASPIPPPIPSMTPEERAAFDKRRGRFMPWIIVAFFAGFVVILVDFAAFAINHPPSEVTPHAYDKGLIYNQTLADADAQVKLGWKADVSYQAQRLRLILKDAQGQPLTGARAKAFFVNAAESRLDRSADLQPGEAGIYSAAAGLPRGNWKIYVTAAKGADEYQVNISQEVE
jgi:nitrogen fixation protein FixH